MYGGVVSRCAPTGIIPVIITPAPRTKIPVAYGRANQHKAPAPNRGAALKAHTPHTHGMMHPCSQTHTHSFKNARHVPP